MNVWVASKDKSARGDGVTAEPGQVVVRHEARSELAEPLDLSGHLAACSDPFTARG